MLLTFENGSFQGLRYHALSVLSISIIFVMTVLKGCWAASLCGSNAVALIDRLAVIPVQAEDDRDVVERLLERASTLKNHPARIDPEKVWNSDQFMSVLDAPENHHEAFAIFYGRLEQVTPVVIPANAPTECFVRVPGIGPVIVLAPPSDLESCVLAGQVRFEGWFHQVHVTRARDGRDRLYLMFVGRLHERLGGGVSDTMSMFVITMCLILGGVWLVIRRRMSSRIRTTSAPHTTPSLDSFEDPVALTPDLSSDPGSALDELARRGDDHR